MSEATGHPWPENTRRLRLADVEFDLQSRSVSRDGCVNELGQRCFDLLLLFLREPGLLHTREEIFRRVWGGVVVEDANITTSIWQLRKALGEDAKGWIRTVAKQGYIFDPPVALEFDPVPMNDTAGPDPSVPTLAPATSVPATSVPAPMTTIAVRSVGYRARVAVVVTLVLLAAFGVLFTSQRPSLYSRIIVLAAPDPSVDSDARWPAELLQNWIRWQLDARSDRFSLSTVSDESMDAPTFVLLSATMPMGRDSEWHLRALLRESSRSAAFDRGSVSDGLLTTIDALSRDVLGRLLPEIPTQDFPSLDALDAAAARNLSSAIAAEQGGRWNDAAAAYRRVLDTAPDFGFAHFHLAISLAELGQSNAACAELALAENWIARLPAGMQSVLRARSLAIRQDYLAAAAEFGALARRSVDRSWGLRIAEATNLRRGGDPRAALLRLGSEPPAASGDALRWFVEKAEAEMAMLQFAAARAAAEEAVVLARRLGSEHERVRAELLVIDVTTWMGDPVEAARYEDTAAGFERAGDRIGSLRARIMRQIAAATSSTVEIAGLNELLAQTRAAGNAAVEIDALSRVGLMYLRLGDASAAREQLHQAQVIAETAGDRYLQQQVAANQLRVDGWREDLAAMERGVRDLRRSTMPGATAFLANLAQARLEFRRGEYAAMLQSANEAENSVRSDAEDDAPGVLDEISIERVIALMRLGRLAEARKIAEGWDRRSPRFGVLRIGAAEARVAVLAGDGDAAKSKLGLSVGQYRKLRSPVHRWMAVTELAPLLAQVGELERGRRLVDEVLPAAAGSGFRGIETDLRIASAEIATAQGRVADARRELGLVRQLLQDGDWQAQHRARIVEIVLLRGEGKASEATRLLRDVHEEARRRNDVLGELVIHSIADAELGELCPAERQTQLVATTGMRGASREWLLAHVERPSRAAATSM